MAGDAAAWEAEWGARVARLKPERQRRQCARRERSAGCQTIPRNHYGSFLSAVGRNPSFFYVLIDGQ